MEVENEQLRKNNCISYTTWTKDEEKLLLQLCHSNLKGKWKKISEIMSNKTPMQCSYKSKQLNGVQIVIDNKDDVLLTNRKVKNYFNNCKSKENLKTDYSPLKIFDQNNSPKIISKNNSSKEIITRCVPSEIIPEKPKFQNDTMIYPDFWEGKQIFRSNSSTKLRLGNTNYNREEGNENEMNYFKNIEDDCPIITENMKRDSSDKFFITKKTSRSRFSTNEFNDNFKEVFNNINDEADLFINESDFVLKNLNENNEEKSDKEIEIILLNAEIYLSSKECEKKEVDESCTQIKYYKLASSLSEVYEITSEGNVNVRNISRSSKIKALELLTIILGYMINITKSLIN